jgi:group II intron reverse transcriptase/maturase
MNWVGKILAPENLRSAWEEVQRNKGTAGIDRVSIKRWGRNWEERLAQLTQQVRTNTYQARKLRQFKIPKKDRTMRIISILTITDRVLQRAVLRIVDDLFDKTFLPCSYGYRPGMGVRNAIPDILKHRNYGKQWVLDADIDNCFPSLNHQLILKYFKQKIKDPTVLGLMKQWVRQGESAPGVGISLGAVISPLLCNIYLHRLDAELLKAGYSLVRYADDFCVFAYSKAEAEGAMKVTGDILARLKLKFEPNKTKITHFDNGFDFLGVHFYRDTYSFEAENKKVEVKGDFDPHFFYDYVPEGYV